MRSFDKTLHAVEPGPVPHDFPPHLAPFLSIDKERFIGAPRITRAANASGLKPARLPSHAGLPLVPLRVEGHRDRYVASLDEHGVGVFEVHDPTRLVGSYCNFGSAGSTLVVDRAHRRQGIGTEMLYRWRVLFPLAPNADVRTRQAQSLQLRVWERIQAEVRAARALAIAEHAAPVQSTRP